jgi:hypothetical protein
MGSDHRLRDVLIKGKNHIENDVRMGRAFHDSEIMKSESVEMDANSSLTSALSASTIGIANRNRVHVNRDIASILLLDLFFDVIDDVVNVGELLVLIDLGM